MTEKPAILPPSHLSPAARKWFRSVVGEFELEDHGIKLLTMACESLDRSNEARAEIKKHGAFYNDRFGAPHAHPAVAMERNAKVTFARLVRELGLPTDGPNDSRPPRPRGRYR